MCRESGGVFEERELPADGRERLNRFTYLVTSGPIQRTVRLGDYQIPAAGTGLSSAQLNKSRTAPGAPIVCRGWCIASRRRGRAGVNFYTVLAGTSQRTRRLFNEGTIMLSV